jgi:hypothetical protein
MAIGLENDSASSHATLGRASMTFTDAAAV